MLQSLKLLFLSILSRFRGEKGIQLPPVNSHLLGLIHARDPKSMQLRMIAGGGGGGLTIEEPENNIVRGALYALAAALGLPTGVLVEVSCVAITRIAAGPRMTMKSTGRNINSNTSQVIFIASHCGIFRISLVLTGKCGLQH